MDIKDLIQIIKNTETLAADNNRMLKALLTQGKPDPRVIGVIDFESGNLSQEARVTNSGGANTSLTDDPRFVHGGQYAAAMYSPGGNGAGTRIRQEGRDWAEPTAVNNLPAEAYYSAWLLIPQGLHGKDNIWQWKQGELQPDGTQTRKFLYSLTLDEMVPTIKTRVDEAGRFFQEGKYIAWGVDAVPVGEWFHLEAFYRWSERPDGKIIFWLNGQEILRVEDVITQFVGMPWKSYPRQWTVNNYHPDNTSYIYCDRMVVSLDQIGPCAKWQ